MRETAGVEFSRQSLYLYLQWLIYLVYIIALLYHGLRGGSIMCHIMNYVFVRVCAPNDASFLVCSLETHNSWKKPELMATKVVSFYAKIVRGF